MYLQLVQVHEKNSQQPGGDSVGLLSALALIIINVKLLACSGLRK